MVPPPGYRLCITALAVILLPLTAAGGQGQQEDALPLLREKEKGLRARSVQLQREQQFLLFEKAFTAADSKYLVLDIRKGKGVLRYRSRLLKSFAIALKTSSRSPRLNSGPLPLSSKKDGKPQERRLVFGDHFLVLQTAKAGAMTGKERNTPRVTIGAKDLASLFFALETGSYLYIIND